MGNQTAAAPQTSQELAHDDKNQTLDDLEGVDMKQHIHPFEACAKRAFWDRKFGHLFTKDIEQ